MNVGPVDSSQASSSLSSRRRRGSRAATNQPDRLNRRDIEFMYQTVSVVKKIGEFGTSYIYSAKDDSRKGKSGRSLLIKATAAGTTEEARRAEAEVRLLRKLCDAPGILKMIDCGFSTIDERVHDYGATREGNEDTKLDIRRLYCTLFEPCPDCFLSDFIKKRRRKYDKRRSRGLFARKKKEEAWEGYLPLSIVLDIFGQMVAAVSALHAFVEETDAPEGERDEESPPRPKKGIVHLDIQPSRFLIRKLKETADDEDRYEVNLCSFGCSVRGGAPLSSNRDRDDAARMIESVTSPIYRSPEMIDLHMTDEITGSADIWGLGCCFYSLLFLTDCFKGHNKLDLMRGVFLIPANHPFERKVIDVLARMLKVNSKQRATIKEVRACVKSLREGTPLPRRRKTVRDRDTGTDRGPDQMRSLNDSNDYHVDLSTALPSRTPGGAAVSADAETMDPQVECLSDAWDAPPGEVSSDGTEFSQWLEFQPETPDGSNLQHRSEPTSVDGSTTKALDGPRTIALDGPTTIIQRKGLRRRRRRNDPLNLGSADNNTEPGKKQPMFADWTLGLITQLSTRSLNPIDTESEGETDNKDVGISPVRELSLRNIKSFGQPKAVKQSGIRKHPYGSRYNLTSQLPSLRVSDLMKDGIPRGVSTSSSEVHSSASNDFLPCGSVGLGSSTYASSISASASASEFYSSAEMPSSSEIDSSATSFAVSCDLSASLPRTALSDATRNPLGAIVESKHGASIDDLNVETPATGPPKVLSRVSPNKGINPPFNSQKEMISPRDFTESREFKRPPPTRANEDTQVSDPQDAPKPKRSKSKKSKKKKSRKKRKPKTKDQIDATTADAQQMGITIVVGDVEFSRQSKSDSEGAAAHRASITSNFSAPEFDPDAKDTDTDGDGGQIGDSPFSGRRSTWGNIANPGDWASNQDLGSKMTTDVKSVMKKNKSLPARAFKTDIEEAIKVEKTFAASASDLDAWDLKAVELWVTTKSQEASDLETQKAKTSERKRKDPYYMKRADNSCETDVPKDWVKDARLWVTSNSPTKIAQLREEMTTELSCRSKPPSEADAAWFSPPVSAAKDETRFAASEVQTTDAAGFPLPPISQHDLDEDPTLDMKPKAATSKPLDRYLTPQNKKETVKIPRSAVSVNDLSKADSRGTTSLGHQTVDCTRRKRVSRSGRGARMLRTPSASGFSQTTARTTNSNKQMSVDSNMPPGDEVVVAEVSVPSATAQERLRHSMSVKEEVHMALTEEGRHMKRSIKKIEAESPYAILSKMLMQEKEAEKHAPRNQSPPSSPPARKIPEQEKSNESASPIAIPTMIALFAAESEGFPRGSVASPNKLKAQSTPKAISTYSGRSETVQPVIPPYMSTPLDGQSAGLKLPPPAPMLSPETPRRTKKKKKSRSHRKDRDGVRKAKSERVNRSEEPNTPRTAMGKSLGHFTDPSDSLKIDFAEAERVAKAQRKDKTQKSKSFLHRSNAFSGRLGELVATVERELQKAKSERINWSLGAPPEASRTLDQMFPEIILARPNERAASPPSPLRLSPTNSFASKKVMKKRRKAKKGDYDVKKTQSERKFLVPETTARATKSLRALQDVNMTDSFVHHLEGSDRILAEAFLFPTD